MGICVYMYSRINVISIRSNIAHSRDDVNRRKNRCVSLIDGESSSMMDIRGIIMKLPFHRFVLKKRTK